MIDLTYIGMFISLLVYNKKHLNLRLNIIQSKFSILLMLFGAT